MGEKMTLGEVRSLLLNAPAVSMIGTTVSISVKDAAAAIKAIDAHLATPTQTVDVEYELWQEDMCIAGACGKREEAQREILHYLSQYAQDGECKILEVTRVNVTDKIFQAIGDKT